MWKKPIVFIDSNTDISRFDAIKIYYDQAVRSIMDCFVEHGHTKIGFVGCQEKDPDGRELQDERMVAVKKYLTEKGMYHPEYIKTGLFHAKYGYKLLKELYEENHLPTALFVANDSMAVGCYNAAYELGIRIPEDISIIGFNDIPAAKYMIPPLTTVRLYMEFMGEYAVRLLEERVLGYILFCV